MESKITFELLGGKIKFSFSFEPIIFKALRLIDNDTAQLRIRVNTLIRYRALKKLFREIMKRNPTYGERILLNRIAFLYTLVEVLVDTIMSD